MRSFRTLLSPRDWLYSLSLLIPLSLYNLSTKLQHIIELEAVGLLEGVHLLRSNFFFSLGFSLWWIGMLAIGRRGPVRWAVLVVLHTTAFVYAVIVTAAYQYFVATGSALDYNLIALALTSFGELKPILASEVSLRSFAIACGYVFFGPPLLVFTANRFHLCSKDSVASDSQPLLGWSMLPLSIAFLLLALIPTASSLGKSFSRDPLLHVLMTAAEREEVTELANRSDVSSAPVEASLVSRPARKTRNLVLIILESTGASSVTPYNEAMATTPYLDELVKNSLLVERAYSTVPHTSKALVSVVCGIEPRPVRSISEALPGLIPATCLPELLDQHGYHTVFFQSASEFFQDRRQLVANFGYQDFYPGESMKSRGFERANYFGFEDDIMLAPSRSWLTRNGDQPFLATYLTVTPHHQYLAPTRYGRVEFTDRKNHNLYLNAVRYQDFFVENLISQYKELGLYDETIFVIIGDHGEAFGEHRRAKHDDILYDEVMKVPFLVHAPEVFGGGERVAGPASLLDVLPSAADLLGFDIAPAIYPGSSVLSIPRDRALFFSCFHENKCVGRLAGWQKFIYHYDDRPDELFDLSTDPGEKTNLAGAIGEDLQQRRAELRQWRASLDETYRRHHRDQIALSVFDSRPPIQNPLDAVFHGSLALVGYDLSHTEVRPGESFRITYHFQVLKPLPPTWRLVLEGRPANDDETPEERQSLTHRPMQGLYRLRFWQPGQYIADVHTVTVPEDWRSSSFVIAMGFFNKRRGQMVRVRPRPAGEDGLVPVARVSVVN